MHFAVSLSQSLHYFYHSHMISSLYTFMGTWETDYFTSLCVDGSSIKMTYLKLCLGLHFICQNWETFTIIQTSLYKHLIFIVQIQLNTKCHTLIKKINWWIHTSVALLRFVVWMWTELYSDIWIQNLQERTERFRECSVWRSQTGFKNHCSLRIKSESGS